MAQDVLITQTRSSTLLAKDVAMRKDQMTWQQASDLGGNAPYDSFWLRTMEGVGTLDVARGDILTDQVTNEQFLVFGRPITFDESFVRIPVEQVSGT